MPTSLNQRTSTKRASSKPARNTSGTKKSSRTSPLTIKNSKNDSTSNINLTDKTDTNSISDYFVNRKIKYIDSLEETEILVLSPGSHSLKFGLVSEILAQNSDKNQFNKRKNTESEVKFSNKSDLFYEFPSILACKTRKNSLNNSKVSDSKFKKVKYDLTLETLNSIKEDIEINKYGSDFHNVKEICESLEFILKEKNKECKNIYNHLNSTSYVDETVLDHSNNHCNENQISGSHIYKQPGINSNLLNLNSQHSNREQCQKICELLTPNFLKERFSEKKQRLSSSMDRLYSDFLHRLIVDGLEEQLQIKQTQFKNYRIGLIIPDSFTTYQILTFIRTLFELGFAGIFMHFESVLSSFGVGYIPSSSNISSSGSASNSGSGSNTCCVIDIGASQTKICCIRYGRLLPETKIVLSYGGKNITEALHKYLSSDLNQYYYPLPLIDNEGTKDQQLWESFQRFKHSICGFQTKCSKKEIVDNASDKKIDGNETSNNETLNDTAKEIHSDGKDNKSMNKEKIRHYCIRKQCSNNKSIQQKFSFGPEAGLIPVLGLFYPKQLFNLSNNDLNCKAKQNSELFNDDRILPLDLAIYRSISRLGGTIDEQLKCARNLILVGGSSQFPGLKGQIKTRLQKRFMDSMNKIHSDKEENSSSDSDESDKESIIVDFVEPKYSRRKFCFRGSAVTEPSLPESQYFSCIGMSIACSLDQSKICPVKEAKRDTDERSKVLNFGCWVYRTLDQEPYRSLKMVAKKLIERMPWTNQLQNDFQVFIDEYQN